MKITTRSPRLLEIYLAYIVAIGGYLYIFYRLSTDVRQGAWLLGLAKMVPPITLLGIILGLFGLNNSKDSYGSKVMGGLILGMGILLALAELYLTGLYLYMTYSIRNL